MKSIYLELTLEADLVQTARPQSMGTHESLEYVRGAVLLGAAAASLYSRIGTRAYRIFHSGCVRFTDARLIDDGGVAALPVPLAWHTRKGEGLAAGEPIPEDKVWVGPHVDPVRFRSENLRQIRSGYFTPEGRYLSTARGYRLKAAIDRRRRGAAAEGQLYGYESLQAGSRWLARIDADEASDLDLLGNWFQGRTVVLGRSRGAEYGRTSMRVGEPPPVEGRPSGSVREVLFHLLSDLALTDPVTSEPTLVAAPGHFDLPPTWRLDPERSAVATRSYSPFNGKRRRHDLERGLLTRGSVLVFSGEPSKDLSEVHGFLERGVGAHREEGLGQVSANPWYLEGIHPRFPAGGATTVPGPSESSAAVPVPPLAAWLTRQGRRVRVQEVAYIEALALTQKARMTWQKDKPWPSRSQWNRVAGIARACFAGGAPGKLRKRLETDVMVRGDGGVGANQWGDALRKVMLESADEGDFQTAALRLYHAARLLRSGDKDERGRR